MNTFSTAVLIVRVDEQNVFWLEIGELDAAHEELNTQHITLPYKLDLSNTASPFSDCLSQTD